MRIIILSILTTLILLAGAPSLTSAHGTRQVHVTCSACGGNGVCWPCHGSGKRSDGAHCSICGGSGKCGYCYGRGEH